MISNRIKFFVFIFVCFLFSSCIIAINENDYRNLKYSDAVFIHPFSLDSTDVVRNQKDKLYLTEINGNDVKQCLNKYPYTWVYVWKPFCHGPNCHPLFYYEKIDKELRDRGIKLLLVSQDYDMKPLRKHLERSAYDREIYLLKDKDYGHKLRTAKIKFLDEIAPSDEGTDKQILDSYLIYKGNKVIYHGIDISSHIIDSVLHSNM